MTGPDLHRPLAGSNAIGRFIVGTSPIGDIPALDPWSTIISQYANSPILSQLVQDFMGYLDPTHDLENFFDLIWNVDTAEGYGLDVWGRIVGVTRVVTVATSSFFGHLGPTGSSGDPYDVSPFFRGIPATESYSLTDAAYRNLIFVKALSNISDGSIPSINTILRTLFPNRGNCYVVDGGDMTMQYLFTFALTPTEEAILGQSGVLMRPAGVQASIVQEP